MVQGGASALANVTTHESSNGGNSAAIAGMVANAGAIATGGAVATGGAIATGGTVATGGAVATGSAVATGGTLSTGGTFDALSGSAGTVQTNIRYGIPGLRVVLVTPPAGTQYDEWLHVLIRIDNNTGKDFLMKDFLVQYWVTMSLYKQIECICNVNACLLGNVGSWRTSSKAANTCLEYSFSAGYFNRDKSLDLNFDCRYIDNSPVIETGWWSDAWSLKPGDEFPHVSVEYQLQTIWGEKAPVP